MPRGSEHLPLDHLDAVIVDERDKCFLWTDTAMKRGYGRLRTRERQLVHRFVYELCIGPIPPGHLIHHVCENKLCVNPTHLAAMERREHVKRHGSGPCRRCGGHRFSTRADGKRDCIDCRHRYQKLRYEVDAEYRERIKARNRARRRQNVGQ